MTVAETPSCAGNAAAQGKVRHHVATPRAWPWLPTMGHGHLAKHPWCEACGAVAAVGGGRALDMGGIANLLARVEKRFRHHGIKLTEAQRRLVMKALHADNAGDAFGQPRDAQLHLIARTLARHVGLQADTVETYVRSC